MSAEEATEVIEPAPATAGANLEAKAPETDDLAQVAATPEEPKKPKKKSVGFASLPEEDLHQHHQEVKKKQKERAKSNPFHKIPAELAYLEKKNTPYPKPLAKPEVFPATNRKPSKELGDLRNMPIKVISVVNLQTEINFDYPTIHLPLQAGYVMVDVKYAGLNSRDMFKIYQFGLNFSNKKIGLGYEFVGIIENLNNDNFTVGDKVVGIVHPDDKKGSLSTSLLINPAWDILVKVDEETLAKLDNVEVNLSFVSGPKTGDFEIESDSDETATKTSATAESNDTTSDASTNVATRKKKLSNYEIPDELPNLAKLVTYPSLYCRARQILCHLKDQSSGSVNVLINGADTNLGHTLLQILATDFNRTNLILIVRESSVKEMETLVNNLPYDPSISRTIHIIPFDVENNDIVLVNEPVPIHYKKPDFIAIEVLTALFATRGENDAKIDYTNLNQYQLDLFIDLVGAKKLFHTHVKFDKIDEIKLPLHEHVLEPITTLFHGQVNEPFFAKILKPKGKGSFVSGCRFDVSVPTYAISSLFQQQSMWNKVWGNTFNGYSWYDEINLRIQQDWVEQGLELLDNDKLKFKIDHIIDWRNKHTRAYIKDLKDKEQKLVLQVEDF